jgi:3-hydroxyisobutyrate dehydrogenase
VNPVAVIGLGDLGLACALRLHEVDATPQGIDPAPARQAEWHELTGLAAAAGLDELSDDVAEIFVCVRTTAQAGAVLDGLRNQSATRDRVAYVITTLEPAFARDIGSYGAADLRVVELPVSGGRAGARRGDLTVMVGGDQATPGDAEFLKRTLAEKVFSFSRFGDATVVKLLNNVLGAYNAAAFANCMALADRAGIDAADCADVIRTATGTSWMAEHFSVLVDDLLAKDAGLLAGELGSLPVIDLADAEGFITLLEQSRALIS